MDKTYKIASPAVGAMCIDTPIIHDRRGFLQPLSDDIDPGLINRVCFVGNFGRGVIRGIHYHKEEWKMYAVLSGAAKFLSVEIPEVFVDEDNELRISEYLKNHPTSVSSYVLSARSPRMLIIPPHRANGWISLEENTNIIFMSNLTYDDALGDDYRFPHTVVEQEHWRMG